MNRPLIVALATTTVLAAMLVANVASACPFCPQVAKTFSEEFATSDVVVIAKLLQPPAPPSLTSSGSVNEAALAKFEVTSILKGGELTKLGTTIATAYFGDGKAGQQFLLMGADPQEIVWTTPLPVNDRSIVYFNALKELPAEGADRLIYFQKYLEDSDDMLARDAFDEFARAPYEAVKTLAPHMNHDQLINWIRDAEIPASRRRLYLTMLGTCGTPADLPMLETMLKSNDRKLKAGLDAMIACYLTLGGTSKLSTINDLFLKSKEAEYADTYAAIMALRFHGSQVEVIPREDLVKSMRYMLERPQLADLVIPDLAAWEDWDSTDKLVELYKTADEKSNWVRVPVINFLRASPRESAKAQLKELEKIDPAAFKRANTFFPGGAAPAEKPPQTLSVEQPQSVETPPASALVSTNASARIARGQNASEPVASVSNTPHLASISRATLRPPSEFSVNRWQIASVLTGCGFGLALVMWGLLRSYAPARGER